MGAVRTTDGTRTGAGSRRLGGSRTRNLSLALSEPSRRLERESFKFDKNKFDRP